MPKINTAYTFDVALVSQADTRLLQANPTLASGDVKVSIDEGAFSNITSLPTVTPASGRNVKVALTAAEMNGSRIVVQFVDAAGAEWCDQLIAIETSPDDLTISNIVAAQFCNVKKNQSLASFCFLMTDSITHAPATGKTVTVTRSIDGGAFGAGTLSSVTEVGNGIYRVDFAAADLNGNVVLLRATASGCDDTFERVVTEH